MSESPLSNSTEGELFRLLAENVKDYAIFVLDAELKVLTWTAGAERLLGYREDEIVGKPADVLFTPEDRAHDAPRKEAEQALATGRGEDDRWHVRKNGERFWSSGVMTPLWDEQRELRGFAKIMRDRTEWKRSDEARLRSEARQTAILQSSLDAIVTVDGGGLIVEFNPAAERMFGRTRDNAIGQAMVDLIIPPDLRKRWLAEWEQRVAGGTENQPERRLELRGLRADGSEFPLELSLAAAPVGNEILYTGFVRDISERKQQEQRRGALMGVARVLAEPQTSGHAAGRIVQAVCEALEWDYGGFWLFDASIDRLRCLQTWRREGLPIDEFERASLEWEFPSGGGLPGRVHATAKPAWIEDVSRDPDFPRLQLATAANLHSAFAAPVMHRGVILGVMEFLSTGIRQPDADLLEMMGALGEQVGQYLQKQQAEEALRKSEERFRGLMEQAPFSIQVFAADGRTVRVNRAWEELWGVPGDQILDYNVLEDQQLQRKGILQQIRRAFEGEASRIPAIEYDPEETIPNRSRHEDSRRWVSAVAYPIKSAAGQVQEVILVHEDVTARRRAEEALRRSEERFRGIVSHSVAGVAETDLEGRLLFANDRYCQIVGRSLDELRSLRMQDLTHPDDLARNVKLFRRLVGDGEPFVIEKRYVRPDGETVWVNNSVSGLRDEDGKVASVVAVCFDITDRRAAEETVRSSEERLRLALDASQMGTWSWDIPTNKVSWSTHLERIHGLEPGTFPGTFEAYQRDMHPEDRDRVLGSIRETLESGREHHIEYRLVLPGGSVRWVEARGKLFRDESGRPVRMLGVCMEVTERKQAEQDLRFLAEASRTLASVVDYESTLQKIAGLAVPQFADWCAVYLPTAEAPGELRQLAVAHADPERVKLAAELRRRWPPDPEDDGGVYRVFRTGEPLLVEQLTEAQLRARAVDDDHFEMLRSLGPQSYIVVPLSLRGSPIGVIAFIAAESGRRYTPADLTLAEDLGRRAAVASENARLYATLRDEARKKDEFLAMLAHELRNPLAPIRSGLDLLGMMGVEDEVLSSMQQQVEHLVRLVDDLLDVSRIMRGKIELRRESVSLQSVLERAVDTVRPLIAREFQTLEVEAPDEPVWLDADPVRLAQVVGNLLNNASKYSEAGGTVRLSARAESGEVAIQVRDWGSGIRPELLPNVFELFTQDQRTIDRSQGGLGIGLTVVKSLVEMHGGRVTARSAGVGQGSEFTVRLPVASRPQAGLSTSPQAAPASGLRILIVDDNVSAAKMLGLLFTRVGNHEVFTAFDGPEALQSAEANRPDLIFLDIGLPGLDGFQVVQQLRSLPDFRRVPIVALTGYGSEADRRRSLEAGFDEHLVKPPSLQTLQDLLARVIPQER